MCHYCLSLSLSLGICFSSFSLCYVINEPRSFNVNISWVFAVNSILVYRSCLVKTASSLLWRATFRPKHTRTSFYCFKTHPGKRNFTGRFIRTRPLHCSIAVVLVFILFWIEIKNQLINCILDLIWFTFTLYILFLFPFCTCASASMVIDWNAIVDVPYEWTMNKQNKFNRESAIKQNTSRTTLAVPATHIWCSGKHRIEFGNE